MPAACAVRAFSQTSRESRFFTPAEYHCPPANERRILIVRMNLTPMMDAIADELASAVGIE